MVEEKELSDAEISARRDAALLHALNTPHKKQSEMKIGKAKPNSVKKASLRKKRKKLPNSDFEN